MITETIYIGRDNSFSLQLIRGGEAINLSVIRSYELHTSSELVFNDPDMFIVKPDGVVEIVIGSQMTEDDLGSHTAWMVTYDHINVQGVRWPNFKLKVKI